MKPTGIFHYYLHFLLALASNNTNCRFLGMVCLTMTFFDTETDPKPNIITLADPQFVSAENCLFPFTWAGQLYYSCAYDPVVSSCFKFCFLQNRILALCSPPTDYQVLNVTVNMTIPRTPTSPPVLVQTVNGWIMIQQKLDASFSFNRSWVDFQHNSQTRMRCHKVKLNRPHIRDSKATHDVAGLQQSGFGGLRGSYYWLGLDRIYALTGGGDFKLRVELQENVTGLWYSVEYLYFQVDNSTLLYKIHLDGYSGDASDGLLIADSKHNISGIPFSTFDNDHDNNALNLCASAHGAGWWYNDCAYGEPNGAAIYFRWFYNATGGFMLQTSRMMVKLAEK